MFKFIDINGIKHAAEYLNSSKVKYDDDVIDTYNYRYTACIRRQSGFCCVEYQVPVSYAVFTRHGRMRPAKQFFAARSYLLNRKSAKN